MKRDANNTKGPRVKLEGACALTATWGPFVKCHLMPRALTTPRSKGDAFPQIEHDQRPKKRRNSWYDPTLVTQAGEDILTSYDTFAINELRRLKLVWQSWGPMQKLATADHVTIAKQHGLRTVAFSDPKRMRLFLLSLLWRAAASDLREFKEVSVSASDLRRLRNIVRDGSVPPEDFFPATLIQLSSLGLQHNQSPLRQIKPGAAIGRFKSRDQQIFRFYFDGLVVHFHIRPTTNDMVGMGPAIVGRSGSTKLNTIASETSWQMENLLISVLETERDFPGALSKAGGL